MYKHCPTIVVILGFVLVLLGYIVSWYIIPNVQEKIVQSTSLVENTPFFQTWQRTPFPMKLKVYFFHVLNPDEVQSGARPRFLEKGPYIYDDYREKTKVKVNEEEDTVEYYTRRLYAFNQGESGCRSDEDEITILNPSVMGTALQIEQMMPAALSFINDALPHLFPGIKDAFLRTKVKDILFDGVRISCKDAEVSMVCNGIKSKRPSSMRDIPGDTDILFSTMNHLNGTEDGPYVVARGLKNTTRGAILKYKGDKYVSVWAGETCNKINGTDTSFNPRLLTPTPSLYFFSMELCRSLRLDFERPSMIGGITTFRYAAPPDMFHPTESNKCFCPVVMNDEDEDVPKCLKAGLFDMFPCLKGVIYASLPHFLDGDPELLKYPVVLRPDREKHGIFMEIEPGTGVVVSGAMRIQLNLQTKKMDDIVYLQNISEGIFPILWTESSIQLPDVFIQSIEKGYKTISLFYILKYVMIAFGFVIMASSLLLVVYLERLWCFSKNGKVSVTDLVDRNRNISTINEVRARNVDDGSLNSSVVRLKGEQNSWSFQN